MGTLDTRMTHVPSGTEQRHAIQNSLQFNMFALFMSGMFHVVFSDRS